MPPFSRLQVLYFNYFNISVWCAILFFHFYAIHAWNSCKEYCCIHETNSVDSILYKSRRFVSLFITQSIYDLLQDKDLKDKDIYFWQKFCNTDERHERWKMRARVRMGMQMRHFSIVPNAQAKWTILKKPPQ